MSDEALVPSHEVINVKPRRTAKQITLTGIKTLWYGFFYIEAFLLGLGSLRYTITIGKENIVLILILVFTGIGIFVVFVPAWVAGVTPMYIEEWAEDIEERWKRIALYVGGSIFGCILAILAYFLFAYILYFLAA